MIIFQFVEEMSKRMNFDYELVLPTSCAGSECYGRKREDGSWSGVMGKYRGFVECYCKIIISIKIAIEIQFRLQLIVISQVIW